VHLVGFYYKNIMMHGPLNAKCFVVVLQPKSGLRCPFLRVLDHTQLDTHSR